MQTDRDLNSKRRKDRPLQGVRVVDFTWVRAGPWAARWLATLGAEVIKVEWPENLDMLRLNRFTVPPGVEPGPNSTGQFADTNAGKLGITVNVRHPKGLEAIKSLISVSDVVIENFSSRIMQRWGLGYEELRRLRPDVVYVSMAGFGQTGRQHYFGTMGPAAQALSGLTHLSGLPGKPPAGWGWSYLDDTGGMYGAMCALTALRHRNQTGQGQHVDLSQMITGITLTGTSFLDKSVNNRESRREGYPPGNRTVWPGAPVVHNYRGPIAAPHNAYRTLNGGYNDWCVIACLSDEEWANLVDHMGSPAWAKDARFASLSGRLEHQDEMDQGIEEWTSTLGKYDLAEKCQAAGVRAMPVQSSEDRVENDPQLRSRGMFTKVEHAKLGQWKFQSAPFRLDGSPVPVKGPPPMIGEHTANIMIDLLGTEPDDLLKGFNEGVFWPESSEPFDYVQKTLDQPLGQPLDSEATA
ncbi:MAG: CoA transferase [Chloroflexi bacterium]|nr:CoA transferase [Chloroflexota bacterium]